jgi:hypothetical protein
MPRHIDATAADKLRRLCHFADAAAGADAAAFAIRFSLIIDTPPLAFD